MYDLKNNLSLIRNEFPILQNCVYLISNSLGAVPKKVKTELEHYYNIWAEEGVSAWRKKWWDLSKKISCQVEELLLAQKASITMMPNATISHWVALSTKFTDPNPNRNKIIMTDLDFPSSIYAVSKIARFMGWKLQIVKSKDSSSLETKKITERIDDKTLFVATSHVCFKSSLIQDIHSIAKKAAKVGAMTVIDGYHAPGIIPVNLKDSGIDFYIGGCLKWLCGGPGNAFLYVRPGLAEQIEPGLTGWLAHKDPFKFDLDLKYTSGPYRFMSGTPLIPCLYTASDGLRIIKQIGIDNIREKSISMTERIIDRAKQRGFPIYSPLKKDIRGGAVSINLPWAFQIKQALDQKKILIDFRKGQTKKEDVIRIGPHFYNQKEEINRLFEEIDHLYSSEEYKKFSSKIDHVT
ncbi:MAG: aminotransferase class V-fold PLP-dependent enzyme [Candidatus Aminicenantes bacterium]